jgi:hypothetical protein
MNERREREGEEGNFFRNSIFRFRDNQPAQIFEHPSTMFHTFRETIWFIRVREYSFFFSKFSEIRKFLWTWDILNS